MRATQEERRVDLGIIGAGSMGKGLLYQSTITPGVRCVALCDLDVHKCARALKAFGIPYEISHSPGGLQDAVRKGRVGVCSSGRWVAELDGVEAVIEASSGVGSALEHSLLAIERGKHLILMNSEIDLMFSPLLHFEARKSGVVCTSCDGDQYGVLKHLVDDLCAWGFGLVMAGNIKGYLDTYATPESIVVEAAARRLDQRMCTAFTDGTKLNIEMSIAANSFGLRTARPGMTGMRLESVTEVLASFSFDEIWQRHRGVVDYIIGAEPGGGVFVVGYCDNPYQQRMLSYYKMGAGPFYLFYRPYHLCHIEAMRSVLLAARERRSFMGPDAGFRTNVFAYAKRDLPTRTALDGIGGFDCYGRIENVAGVDGATGLPIGIARGAVLLRPVARDERIAWCDVTFPPDRVDVTAYSTALELSVQS